MCQLCENNLIPRRVFLKTAGILTAGLSLSPVRIWPAEPETGRIRDKRPASVCCAFVYPPSRQLEEEGYYSWPGTGFDAEDRQTRYTEQLRKSEKELGINLSIPAEPLDTDSDVGRFIQMVKRENPDGLLLIPFKKGHWEKVVRIIDETGKPTIILATLGVLLNTHLKSVKYRPGIYLINSLDNLDAVKSGLKMIRTGQRMQNSLILNITGLEEAELTVPYIGTRVRLIPHQRFYDLFKEKKVTQEVEDLATEWLSHAVQCIEPDRQDVVNAARTYFVFRRLLDNEQGDAIMMNCLPGLKHPHKHVPPCLGYMKLRDEGVPMGCESDLDATLTMMLEQQLFDRPAFQHNPSADTEKNHYFGAHCTAPTKLMGIDSPAEPYMLRNHAEAGWGAVPRVLMKTDQEVTIAKYLSSKNSEKPELLLYSGKIVGCPPNPPAGGCRTNIETTINELDDVALLKGHHLCMVYGNFVRELKTFGQLYDIKVTI